MGDGHNLRFRRVQEIIAGNEFDEGDRAALRYVFDVAVAAIKSTTKMNRLVLKNNPDTADDEIDEGVR